MKMASHSAGRALVQNNESNAEEPKGAVPKLTTRSIKLPVPKVSQSLYTPFSPKQFRFSGGIRGVADLSNNCIADVKLLAVCYSMHDFS